MNYIVIFDEMKLGFKQSWFYFLFKFTTLGHLFTLDATPNAWKFFNIYVNSWWLTRSWFKSFLQNQDEQETFQHLENGLVSLQRANLFNPANFERLTSNANLKFLSDSIRLLEKVGLLNQNNLDIMVANHHPEIFSCLLSDLYQSGILNQTNFDAVVLNPDFIVLANVLSILKDGWILTQGNLDALIAPNHRTLLSFECFYLIWILFPTYRLTQDLFERLLEIVEDNRPFEELVGINFEIMGINPLAIDASEVFNHAQSTHTASVHRSVSASASNLHNSYPNLNFDASIAGIRAYVNSLDDSLKNTAAKKCIQRITSVDYTYTDTTSNVSTLQLLALAWYGIHDESKCEGKLEDRLALFIEGLYEIQRGYNLDEEGNDNLATDAPICVAGTFNKIIEKLKGIHHDVAVNYITHVGAMLKFPKLVSHHALKYLSTIACPETMEEYTQVRKLLDDLQEQGMVVIWQEIKEAVETELWDDFQEAYADNKQRFEEIINNGVDVDLPNLDQIESLLFQSLGYQKINQGETFSSMKLSQQSLFATTQDLDISASQAHAAYHGA